MKKWLIVLMVGMLGLAASTAAQAHSPGYYGHTQGAVSIGYGPGGVYGGLSVWYPGPAYAPAYPVRRYRGYAYREHHYYCKKHRRYHDHHHGHHRGKGYGAHHGHGGHHGGWYGD